MGAASGGSVRRGEGRISIPIVPWNAEALTKDLALNTLFNAMAQGDKFVFEVARKVVLSGLQNDLETIRYRQNILQDCLDHPAVVRSFTLVAVEAMEEQKKHYLGSSLAISRMGPTRFGRTDGDIAGCSRS